MQARDLDKKDKCNDFLKYKGTLNLFFLVTSAITKMT
jgi:hypothetical protein